MQLEVQLPRELIEAFERGERVTVSVHKQQDGGTVFVLLMARDAQMSRILAIEQGIDLVALSRSIGDNLRTRMVEA